MKQNPNFCLQFFRHLDRKISRFFEIYAEHLRVRPFWAENLQDYRGISLLTTPQKWPYLHERCPLNWTEWKINIPIFAIFIFWVTVDFVYNFPVSPSFVSMSPTKNDQKNFVIAQKWPYLHERCVMCWNEWKINFPIFSFRDMGIQNLPSW